MARRAVSRSDICCRLGGDETVIRYVVERQRAQRERTEHARFRDVLACTSDGVRVTLQANVGVASDLAVARDNGAEGIGLYRTEFPCIVRDSFPTRAEQVKIYSKAYELFPAGPVNFRILDLVAPLQPLAAFLRNQWPLSSECALRTPEPHPV